MPYSYCGRVYCSESTICGYVPSTAGASIYAVCGIAICGRSICGVIPVSLIDTISAPPIRNVNAISQIYKSNGEIYNLDLISCNVTISNPINDSANFEAIDNNILEIGDRIHLWTGYATKYLIFVGDIIRLTRDESGITKVELECPADILKYKYLKSDETFTSQTREDVIEDFLDAYSGGLTYSLNIRPDPSFLLTNEYWAWDKTIFDIITDIMWDHNIYYKDKTLYITTPNEDLDLTLNYYSGKFQSWSKMEEQGNQFKMCHVDGSEHTKDLYSDGHGIKELCYNKMTATTQTEVNRLAEILLTENNETIYEVHITLPYLFPPQFGLVHVKLPGLDTNLIIKGLQYSVSGTELYTTISLGTHRSQLSQVLDKLVKDSNRIHFIY